MEERDYYQGKVDAATPEQQQWVNAHQHRTTTRRPTSEPRPRRRRHEPAPAGAGAPQHRAAPEAGDAEATLLLDPRHRQVIAALGPALRQEGRARRASASRWSWSSSASSTSSQGAEFLGIVQVFVYTGAVMMLFLFVLMLVGVDSSDSLVETIKGQRLRRRAARARPGRPADRGDRPLHGRRAEGPDHGQRGRQRHRARRS